MGSRITDNTALGKRATPIRIKTRRIINRIAANPPQGVVTQNSGGPNHVSPTGYFAARLYDFAREEVLRTIGVKGGSRNYSWSNKDSAREFVKALLHGSAGRNRQLDILAKFLPVIEAEFPPVPRANRQGIMHDELNLSDDPEQVLIQKANELSALADETLGVKSPVRFNLSEAERQQIQRLIDLRTPHEIGLGDPEIDAMIEVKNALEPLDDNARKRVLLWASSKFHLEQIV